MQRVSDFYRPFAAIIFGAGLNVVFLSIIKYFYPIQDQYLPWQPLNMAVALGSGMWLGKARLYRHALFSYIMLGILLAGASGLLGMIYLKLNGFINHIDQYAEDSPLGVLYFIILVAQSFAIGALSTDGRMSKAGEMPDIKRQSSSGGISDKGLLVAIASLQWTKIGAIAAILQAALAVVGAWSVIAPLFYGKQ